MSKITTVLFQRKVLKRDLYLLLGCTLYTLRCFLLPRSKSKEEKSDCLSRKETESSNNTTFVTCGHHPRWGFYGSCTFSTLHNLNQRQALRYAYPHRRSGICCLTSIQSCVHPSIPCCICEWVV